ncbi:MAG: calcium/sodium antiporter [Bacteroidales bacterium]|jgi:cation:H+ antiporter|nr:calcium/sodium antiporter [Bacteroidales bacterium]
MEYVILIISLLAIVFGADRFVGASAAIARRLKISDFVIGAVVVGFGTSFPELLVSLKGAISGNADVAIGNVVGSNILNVLGILGVTALLFPIATTRENIRRDAPFCVGVSVLLVLLAFDFFTKGETLISRIDGIVLLAVFAFFLWITLRKGSQDPSDDTQVKLFNEKPLWYSITVAIVGLSVLIIGCHFFVEKAVVIARNFGVSDAYISITLIACGTSLPELAASITAAFKKNTQIALGNVIGSNILNILFILGTSSLVRPLHSPDIVLTDYLVMTGAALLLMIFATTKVRISRFEGLLMLAAYVAYNIWLFSMQG